MLDIWQIIAHVIDNTDTCIYIFLTLFKACELWLCWKKSLMIILVTLSMQENYELFPPPLWFSSIEQHFHNEEKLQWATAKQAASWTQDFWQCSNMISIHITSISQDSITYQITLTQQSLDIFFFPMLMFPSFHVEKSGLNRFNILR